VESLHDTYTCDAGVTDAEIEAGVVGGVVSCAWAAWLAVEEIPPTKRTKKMRNKYFLSVIDIIVAFRLGRSEQRVGRERRCAVIHWN